MIVKLPILSKLPTGFVVTFKALVLIFQGVYSVQLQIVVFLMVPVHSQYSSTLQPKMRSLKLLGKAGGYDQIPMTVIKKSILLVSEPLTHIINLSIQHGIVPDEMKIARVIPIFYIWWSFAFH